MSARALVAYGDATSVRTWSNVPYFFLRAGIQNGLFRAGVVLRPEQFRARRLLWNASRPFTMDQPRGFMYSRRHLRELWAQRDAPEGVNEYVSHYQLLPPREIVRDPITYYIDATIRQFFDDYEYRIGRRIRADALAREREAYLASRFVVCMSRWAADDVTSSYDIPPEKVRVIIPGANIDEDDLEPSAAWNGELSPIRLGCVGVDWVRKGGPLVLEIADNLQRMGFAVEVVVIGPEASTLPDHPALRPLGFIDKAHELGRFVKLIRSFHFGCLLSRAEASGYSSLEFMRLGVPLLVTSVGGLEDPGEAGIRVSVEATAVEIAEEIATVVREPEHYGRMRRAASVNGGYYSWQRSVDEFLTLLESRDS